MKSQAVLRAVVWVMAVLSLLGLGASIVVAQTGPLSFWTTQTFFDLQRLQGVEPGKNKFNVVSLDHVWNRGTQTACIIAQHFPESGPSFSRFFSLAPGQAATYRPYVADQLPGRGFTRYLSVPAGITNNTVACSSAVQACLLGTGPCFYGEVEFDHEQSANTCGKADDDKCNLYCPATQKGYTGSAKYRIPVASGFINGTTAAATVPPAAAQDCSPCSDVAGRCLAP